MSAPRFRYVAIAPGGALTQGEMEAPDHAALVDRLRRQGSLPVRVEPATGRGFAARVPVLSWRRRGLRRWEVAALTRELATMLGAGQDLDRALRFLNETAATRPLARVLGGLRDAVRDGSTFAGALAQHPASFSRLYVGLVRAGEAGGVLGATLERLAVLQEREHALAATVTSAMIYPGILMAGAVGSVVLLLTSVLPEFVPLFAESGAELPASTQFLIATGDALAAWGLPALAGVAVLALVAGRVLRRPAPRRIVDRLRLRLPVVGALAREVLAARLTRTLGTLLVNGMPLIAALDIVREVLGNTAGVAAVASATEAARGGAGLARPLAASGLFPVRTIHLLELGEETAQLGPMALRAAEIHEEQTRLAVQRLVALLTPTITIGMGGLIAVIVGSLMQAMLGLDDLAR